MIQERLHTDEQLKQIELKQIAIDAEKWPRKQVEAFFERQGMQPLCYYEGVGGKYIRDYANTESYTDIHKLRDHQKELTLPDALRWEELHAQSTFDKATEAMNLVGEIREEIARLKAELKRLKSKPERDNRVEFGDEVVFSTNEYRSPGAFIGNGYAKEGDCGKVLISAKGYRWQLHEDYHEGRSAVSLIKIDEE